MSKPIQVSASVLCADFANLGDEIKKCEDAGVDMIHVDVMDGHFVPNISVGGIIVETIRPLTKLPIEAHLMIENPWNYIEGFADQGSDIISVHVECYGQRREECKLPGQYPKVIEKVDLDALVQDIQKIKKKGKKVFIVVNPDSPLCFEEVEKDIDGILIMSVNPGFAKQKHISGVLEKVRLLKDRFHGDIAIDGGINQETAPAAVKAGANILATASYFFGSKDPKEAVQDLKRLTMN